MCLKIILLSMHLSPRMTIVLDFICMGSVELRGTSSKRKLQNETFSSTVGFEPTPGILQSQHFFRITRFELLWLIVLSALKLIIYN